MGRNAKKGRFQDGNGKFLKRKITKNFNLKKKACLK